MVCDESLLVLVRYVIHGSTGQMDRNVKARAHYFLTNMTIPSQFCLIDEIYDVDVAKLIMFGCSKWMKSINQVI